MPCAHEEEGGNAQQKKGRDWRAHYATVGLRSGVSNDVLTLFKV